MIVSRNRAAKMSTLAAVPRLMPRFRPIAPKPGGAGPSVPATALSSTSSCLPKRTGRGRKRSAPAALTAASSKRLKKPSCIILPRPEIRTLALLPDSEPASTSSPPCVSAVTSTAVDAAPELELRLGHSSSSTTADDSETGISSCSSSSRSPGLTSASSSTSPPLVDLKLLEQAYSSCPEPIAIADEQDHILWCNPAYNGSSSSLGTPVPVSSFLIDDAGTRIVVWAFWKDFSFVGPCSKVSRPRPVRATPLLVVPSPSLVSASASNV